MAAFPGRTLEPRIDQTSAQSFEVNRIPRNQREPMGRGRSSKERIQLVSWCVSQL